MKHNIITAFLFSLTLVGVTACGGSSSQTGTDLPEDPGSDTPEEPGDDQPSDDPVDDPGDDDPTDDPVEDDVPPQARNWGWVYPGPQGYDLNAITNDGEQFMAVGNYGAIMTSPDGESWTSVHYDGGGNLLDVVHHDGHYVAVGGRNTSNNDGLILYSEDGEEWERAEFSRRNLTLRGVVWTGDGYTAMGDRTTTHMRSSNGTRWHEEGLGYDNDHSGWGSDIIYSLAANGRHVIATSRARIDYSGSDGFIWSHTENFGTTGAVRRLENSTFDGDNFLAVGGHQSEGFVISPNGINWETTGASDYMASFQPTKQTFLDVVRAQDHYWLTDIAGSIDKLAVGTEDWSPVLEGVRNSSLNGIEYLDGNWVAVGDSGRIVHSGDGESWTELRSTTGSEPIRGLAKNVNGRLVAIRGEAPLAISDDGESWTSVELPDDASNFQDITTTPDGSTFIAVGNTTLAVSTDGENWEVNRDFNHLNFQFVAASNDTWVIGNYDDAGRDSQVLRCTAIDDCELHDTPGYHSALTWHGGHFVLASRNGQPRIHRSLDGESWTTVDELDLGNTARRNHITHLAGNDDALVLLRQVEPDQPRSVDVSVSTDGGETWEALELGEELERDTASVVAVGDTLMVADHRNNLAWQSTDGVEWESSSLSHRLEAIVEKDGYWYATAGSGVLKLH